MFIDQAIRFALIAENLPPPPCKVLEVGCGGGELAVLLGDRGYEVHACDLHPNPSARMTKAGISYFQVRNTKLAVDDRTFDCAISSDVLEHVQPNDRPMFISELFRVTKPGGTLVFTVFVRSTLSFRLWGAVLLMFTKTLPSWYIEHITIPTPEIWEIEKLVLAHGSLLKLRQYQACLNVFATSVQNVVTHWRAQRLGLRLAPLIARLDLLGAKTSCLFVARRNLEQPS